MSPRLILDLRDSPWVDGPGRTVLDTASTIVSDRYTIVIGAFAGPQHGAHDYLAEAQRRRLQTLRIVERRSLDWDVLAQIVRACREQRVDLVHAHDFRSNLYGLIAARRAGIPAVTTAHGWIANDRKGALYTGIDRRLLRHFDCVVVVSDLMRRQLVKAGVPGGKVRVIHNALVLDRYAPDRGDKSAKSEWGVPAQHRLVGSIGRLSPEKCLDQFVRAAATIARDLPDVSFVIVGRGPEERRLRALVTALGIEQRVVFAGHRTDMPTVYNSLDLVVQASRTEGMPNVVLEALAMRVPVVATDVGGTSEIILDGVCGRLVPPLDADALARAMREALGDASLVLHWTETGERRVRAEFGHDKRLRAIVEVYDEVLARIAAGNPDTRSAGENSSLH